MLSVKKILYPTDFSSFSTAAYFHAVALAEHHNASLTVLYVYNSDDSNQPSNRQFWREQLEQIRPTNTAIPLHHVLLDGDAATAIVRYATDARMDLVVMGTHGRNQAEPKPDTLMGTVAEQVMRGALCSVLVVKLRQGQPNPEHPHVGYSVAQMN